MVCYEYHFITFPFSRKNKNSQPPTEIIGLSRQSYSILFDLSKCKCSDMVSNCKCAKAHTVPANERQFLQDQRRQRKMIIGGIDQKETSKLKRKAERQEAKLKLMNNNNNNNNNFRVSNIRVSNRTLIYNVCPE